MSYLVLARKFRPQTFKQVVGQQHVARTLMNAVATGRTSHAYLLTGTRGVGKTSVARIFAKALNCADVSDGEPCNECETCLDITEGSHMDVVEIDGASNRGIDDIRELREKVNYAPARGGRKIYIIDEVHQITRDAFNALLKTLEEPPPSVVFIFATTEPQKLPQTILSRCQRFDFRRIAQEEIQQHLGKVAKAEKIEIEDEALYLVARKADGSMRDGQSYLDLLVSYNPDRITAEDAREVLGVLPFEIYLELMEIIADRDQGRVFEYVGKLQEQVYDYYDFALELLVFLRNLLMVKTASAYREIALLPEALRDALHDTAHRFSTGDLSRIITLAEQLELSLRKSVFPRITVETSLVRIASLASTVEIDSLLSSIGLLPERGTETPAETAAPKKPVPSPESVAAPDSVAPPPRSSTVSATDTATGVPEPRSPSGEKEPSASEEERKRSGPAMATGVKVLVTASQDTTGEIETPPPAEEREQTAPAEEQGQTVPAEEQGQTAPAEEREQTAPAEEREQTAPAEEQGQTAPAEEQGQTAPAEEREQTAPEEATGVKGTRETVCLNLEKVCAGWNEFCRILGERHQSLAGFLIDAELRQPSENTLSIGVGETVYGNIATPESIEILEDGLHDFFGEKPTVRIKKIPNNRRNRKRLDPTEDPNHPEARRREARRMVKEEPALEKLVSLFDAEIVDG